MADDTEALAGSKVRPGGMIDPGRHDPLFEALPHGVAALVPVVQGLLLHEHLAPIYGVTLAPEQRQGSHIRDVEAVVDAILALDPRPLPEPRPLDRRLVCTCRTFTLLLVAMLRRQGVPARARCGFAGYFQPGLMIDHWVAEVLDDGSWRLVDAQIDARARDVLAIPFDPLDVPRDRFLVAGEAWAACRAGRDDAGRFGIFEMRGDWFIAGNVVRDIAALNGVEMLPWDDWGGMPGPDEVIAGERADWLDRLAAASQAPGLAYLRPLYEDARVRVPATVFNAVRQRDERV